MTGITTPPATRRPDLLDPAEVARLGGLEVTTELIVDGFLAGLHRSPRRGFSVEFAEHRPYQPGDDPRHIDWKLMARADRLQVKQFEEETNLRSILVVDASASMGWSGAAGRPSKLDYAVRLAAALALVLLRQRDAVGMIGFDEEIRRIVPSRGGRSQWHRVAGTLAGLRAGTGTAAEPALRQVTASLARRGMAILISDLLVDRELVVKALRYLRHRGHSVMVVHLADPAEMELAEGEETSFRDPEGGESITLVPSEWREAYRETVDGVVAAWRAGCRGAGASYHLLTTDQPFGIALGRILSAP